MVRIDDFYTISENRSDGDIVEENIKDRIRVKLTYFPSSPHRLYFANFKLKDGSKKFFRSNGKIWEKCNSEKESYKYVPEEYVGVKHKWKSKWKQFVCTTNSNSLIIITAIISIFVSIILNFIF